VSTIRRDVLAEFSAAIALAEGSGDPASYPCVTVPAPWGQSGTGPIVHVRDNILTNDRREIFRIEPNGDLVIPAGRILAVYPYAVISCSDPVPPDFVGPPEPTCFYPTGDGAICAPAWVDPGNGAGEQSATGPLILGGAILWVLASRRR
jgi:hypothetical protein